MIKHLRVTVDGRSYYVTVELADEPGTGTAPAGPAAPAAAAPPAQAPAAPPSVAPAPTAANPATPAPAAAPAPSGASGPGDVPSPLAGWVVAIDAAPGQQVNSGDRLLTLEAMKMNTFVNAPVSGKVTEVLVAVGGAVEQGQILVRIR